MIFIKEEKGEYSMVRENFKNKIYSNFAINIGYPGDMVTGSAFQSFSSDSARAFLCSLEEENIRDDFNLILRGLCASVKVINSQKRKVNIQRL